MLRLIKFLVYSNFWIGLGGAAFIWQYYLIYNLTADYWLIAFVFFATIFTYTFQRYIKILNRTHGGGNRLEWMEKNPILVKVILIVSALGCVYPFILMDPKLYFLLIGTGILSLFYIVKIPGKFGRNLRDIPSLKIFIIGLVWATTSSFLPYINQVDSSVEIPWVLFIADFLFIIAITIPFDIRDMQLDEVEKKTIPQVVGVKKAIGIAIFLLLLNVLFLYYLVGTILYFSIIGVVLSIILVQGCQKTKNDFYFSFFIDGLLLVQPLLIAADLLLLRFN